MPPVEVLVAQVVARAGPCTQCAAAALYCDPDVREDDLAGIQVPVPSHPGYELVGVLRCAVCSTCNGFVTCQRALL